MSDYDVIVIGSGAGGGTLNIVVVGGPRGGPWRMNGAAPSRS
jgi:hypothetical protein